MASLIDKQTVLVNGLDKIERQLHRYIYNSLRNEDYEAFDDAMSSYQAFTALHGKVPHQINDARFKRVKRIRSHITNIIKGGNAVFLTLTFNDNTMASTNAKTRRRYVSRYLKANCDTYVANKDFGETNEREHYHALVLASRVDFTKWHSYGAIQGEKTRTNGKDVERISRYIAKLTFHSIKQTADFEHIIYSR